MGNDADLITGAIILFLLFCVIYIIWGAGIVIAKIINYIIRGRPILFILNYFFLQWFFVRLAKMIDTKTGKIVGWKLLKWIVPLTGWNSDYIYMKKNRGHKNERRSGQSINRKM